MSYGCYQCCSTCGIAFSGSWRLCVDVARRRSAVGDVDARRVRSDAGGVGVAVTVGLRVAVGAQVVDAAAGEKPQMTMQSRVAEIKALDSVIAVDKVACTNARNTRVLVLNDEQCTCACVCS